MSTPDPGSPAGPATRTFPCANCGARLAFVPGTTSLKCPYCGSTQQVARSGRDVREHDYVQWASAAKPTGPLAANALVCSRCGARTESDDIASVCQFCGSPMVADLSADPQIVPEGLVPFDIDTTGAQEALRRWVRSRWFAPNRLKRVNTPERLRGTYLPHWTFDASTTTDYRGMRGEHYWETETYTEMVDGQPQTRTRQVMRTRWWPASGRVQRYFDDVVVVGTTRLDRGKLAQLAPWHTDRAVPYQPDYLSGYQALRYDVEPDQGLVEAKEQMKDVIEGDCRDDIGGDEQRVQSMQTSYAGVMFKLLLLPVWIAAYLYGGRSYQVLVNAHTGQVIGERPYSVPKIAAAVVAGLVLLAVGVYLYQRSRTG